MSREPDGHGHRDAPQAAQKRGAQGPTDGTGRAVAHLHGCRATGRTVALGRVIGGEGLPTGTDTPQATDGGETWHVRQGQADGRQRTRAARSEHAERLRTFEGDGANGCPGAARSAPVSGHGGEIGRGAVALGRVIGGEELRTVALDEADSHAPQDAPQATQERKARRPTDGQADGTDAPQAAQGHGVRRPMVIYVKHNFRTQSFF